MTTRFYWPYDEVTLDLSRDREQLIIQAPWLKATLPVSAENASVADELVTKFQTQTLNPQDLDLISGVFQALHAYPFCYVMPTPAYDPTVNLDHAVLHDESLIDLAPRAILSLMDLSEEDVTSLMQDMGRQDWEWDATAALEFAHTGHGIHPESLVSVIRRFHLLEVMEQDQGSEIFRRIEDLPEDSYRRVVTLLVRQNHYVTEQCQASLAPALETACQAKERVAAFMAAEKGHDLILGSALKSMATDPSQVPVCVATRALMQLLKFVAGRNLLAFAMVVEMFERSSYQSMDPLAALLAKGGYDKAAALVNRHKEINDAGGHENVAVSFLAFMAPCHPDYAREAVRLAELVSVMSNRVTGSVWKLFQETYADS